MFFDAQMLLNVVPRNDRSTLFDQHQRRVNEYKNVSGNVESLPVGTVIKAASFRQIQLIVAASVRIFDDVEQIGPRKPEKCCNQNSREVMLEDSIAIAKVQRRASEVEERRREDQSPEPSEFHKVHVEQIVGS